MKRIILIFLSSLIFVFSSAQNHKLLRAYTYFDRLSKGQFIKEQASTDLFIELLDSEKYDFVEKLDLVLFILAMPFSNSSNIQKPICSHEVFKFTSTEKCSIEDKLLALLCINVSPNDKVISSFTNSVRKRELLFFLYRNSSEFYHKKITYYIDYLYAKNRHIFLNSFKEFIVTKKEEISDKYNYEIKQKIYSISKSLGG